MVPVASVAFRRKVMDTLVTVVGQLNTSGTFTFAPPASWTPGFGPGMPETRVTVPVPPVVVIEVIAAICALYAIPAPLFDNMAVTFRVPGSVPSDRAPIETASAGASVLKFAAIVRGPVTVTVSGLEALDALPLKLANA